MNGEADQPETSGTERRVRKPRPEVQLYRPGMLRKGDSTKSLAADEKPPRPDKLKTSEAPAPSSSRRRSNDADSVTSRGGSGSTTPDANVMNERNQQARNRFSNGYHQHDRRGGGPADGGSSYNSTQSLYDNRRHGGYTDNRSNHRAGGSGGRYQNQRQQPFERPNYNRGFNERASMRGDGAITKRHQTGGRRRNDSINSTQSEMPPSTNDQLHIDTTYDSVSQCGASSTFSMNSLGEAFSFEEMCQNLQSFASMDWSKEVEEEFVMQKEREEEEARLRREEKSKGRLQEANGQVRKGRNRRNRRNDESDRESSFGGSIAEENEEEDELKSGEKTPTSTRSSIPAYNPRMLYQKVQKANNENNGYSRRPNYQQEAPAPKKFEKKGSYRGEHDDRDDDTSQYDAIEQHMTSGRLAGRISIVQRDHPIEEKNRNRPQAQSDELTKTIQKRSTPSEMPPSREVLNRRRKEEIERNEGVQIKELGSKIEKLAGSIKKRDLKAAEKAIKISLELAKIYSDVIFPDIVYSFTAGIEQKLFRQAFYKSIEALRSGANSSAADSKLIRAATQKLLLDGILFYEQLIRRYETTFEINLENALIWPNGFPSDEDLVENTVLLPFGAQKFESASQKTAIKSLSRHLISLGDLHRYKCLMDGSENYEISKSYYLKSAQLWPSSGHPYNQLGIVVFYSMLYRSARRARLVPIDVLSRQRQKRVIDEFFFLSRALGCSHPYEAARDRLTQRLDAMRNKVAKYQPVLDKECGTVKAQGSALRRLQGVRQLWINPITEAVEDGTGEKIVDDILSHFLEQPKAKLHRRAVSYLCDTFGMLVTKIGMEHFSSVSERALALLFASISKPETDFSAEQLVKLSAMFIHAVQFHFSREDGQLQVALDTAISFYSVLVDVFLTGRSPLLLPAINVISTWICHEQTRSILERVERIATLPSTILTSVDGFETIQKVLEVEKEVVGQETREETFPEHVLLTSFYKLFDHPEQKTLSGDLQNARIGQMIRCAQVLKDRLAQKKEEEGEKEEEEDEDQVTPRTRQQMVENEREKGAVVVVIHPEHLIPDTNVLIGDLQLVKDLLTYKNLQVLLPTIVIEELSRLSLITPSPADLETHDPERMSKAKLAMRWLREQAKLKTANLYTLTTTGKRMASVVLAKEELENEQRKMTNDDRILQSALKWTENAPAPSALLQSVAATSADANAVFRTGVLLTGDRGLTIKAVGSHLPCRGIANFARWIAQ